jgi:hypothetical protein
VTRLPRITRADLLPTVGVAGSVVGPLVVLRLTGHLEASLYARRGPHLDQLLMQGEAGLL